MEVVLVLIFPLDDCNRACIYIDTYISESIVELPIPFPYRFGICSTSDIPLDDCNPTISFRHTTDFSRLNSEELTVYQYIQ